ncbi:cellulose binding domain-containing protein [Actinoplanes sp. NPDC051861]|uniref:cellulose binding domain-containing protein n=1 Tax=Actinoplanes sp. NPDC051861 TaxID=3155170 RepID=UPI003449D0C5
MNDSPRPRRSPTVVLLDSLLRAVTAVQTGNLPGRREPGAPPRRTAPLWLLAGVLGTAGGVILLIGVLVGAPGGLIDLPLPGKAAPAPPVVESLGPAATTQQAPSARPSATSAKPSPSASPSLTSAVPAPSSPAGTAGNVLTAAYTAANGSGLLGYRATVTLTAEGTGPSRDWRLSITLPRATLQIGGVQGATAEQDGAVWTLTPQDATRTVTPGTPVVITFDVRGATLVDSQPTGCQVNDEPCTGLE